MPFPAQPGDRPPDQLQASLEHLGRSLGDKVGIAVKNVADTWSAG